MLEFIKSSFDQKSESRSLVAAHEAGTSEKAPFSMNSFIALKLSLISDSILSGYFGVNTFAWRASRSSEVLSVFKP